MFSTDTTILQGGTPAWQRMREYEKLFDGLHIIVVTNIATLLRSFFESARLVKKDPKSFIVSTQEEFTGLVGFLLKARFGIGWQAQIHTDLFNPIFRTHSIKNRLRVFIARILLPHASGIRVVGERVKKDLERMRITRAPITVLPIYVGRETLQPISKMHTDTFEILMTSRLTAEKNIEMAIRVFLKLRVRYKDIKLIIVGEGPIRKKLEALASGRAYFEGWQNDVRPYLARADCFLLTSWYEGYGMSVIEAMAAGLPIVMTDVGVAGGLIKQGVSGLIVPLGDEEALGRALEDIINNPEKRKQMGEEARKAVMHMPSKEEYLRLFKESILACKN